MIVLRIIFPSCLPAFQVIVSLCLGL